MSDAPKSTDASNAHLDPGEIPFEQLSLCLDCAKHPSLKRFVERHSVEGPVCGVCEQLGYSYPVCDPNKIDDLVNLIKSLIRLYYNEFEYNSHWGADDEPQDLLSKVNPIIETASDPDRVRNPIRTSEFFYNLLSQNPYPPEDSGISLYAGHDEGVRLMQFSLQDDAHPALSDFRLRLRSENYFRVEPDILRFLSRFSNRIARTIPAGARYFRARIGIEARYDDQGTGFGWKRKLLYQPFAGEGLGAPPPQHASAGRLNRAGIAFLYLASSEDTAAAEVRPHPGHRLSVGQFENLSELKVAYFDPDIAEFSGSEADLLNFHFVHSADRLMSLPVTPEERPQYTITQLIADCCRQLGFDGISFKSSVGSGENLCVFDPDRFAYVSNSSKVIEVTSLLYGIESKASILNPGPRHRIIK